MEAFLKSLSLRTPMGILEERSTSKLGYNFRPIFGTGRLWFNQWNCKFYLTNMLNSRLICTRDFNSLKNTPKNVFLRHKVSGWTHERSRRQFLKRSFMTKCKLPLSNKPTSTTVCYSSSLLSCLSTLKLYSFIKKYFLPPLSYHHESVSSLRSVLYPKPIEKSFSKICHQKGLQSLEHPENLRSLGPSSKYLKRLEYLLKQKLLSSKFCKQYSSSRPVFYSSWPHLPSQEVSKSDQKIPKKLLKSQRNKKQTHKTSVYRGLYYPIFLHRVHWRGFHSSLFPLAKSNSNKPSTCEKMDKICKPTEVKKTEPGQPCKEKSDVCRQEKVKCDKSQQNKEKTRQKPKMEKKIVDPALRETCLPIGKCELPRTVPPPKMEYAKVTCPPPKFVKPKPCPPVLEHFQNNDKSRIEIKEQTNTRKKQIRAPLPLPKPPFAPIVLCPCPPPRKVHPGPCPCYETKEITKRLSMQPCQLKKKYPCPTNVHYCSPQEKPCNLKQEKTDCEHRKKKETPAS